MNEQSHRQPVQEATPDVTTARLIRDAVARHYPDKSEICNLVLYDPDTSQFEHVGSIIKVESAENGRIGLTLDRQVNAPNFPRDRYRMEYVDGTIASFQATVWEWRGRYVELLLTTSVKFTYDPLLPDAPAHVLDIPERQDDDVKSRLGVTDPGAPGAGKFASTDDKRTSNNTMRQQYRTLSDDEKTQVDTVKELGSILYDYLDTMQPKEIYVRRSEELRIACEKVEEAVMWGVKHITR